MSWVRADFKTYGLHPRLWLLSWARTHDDDDDDDDDDEVAQHGGHTPKKKNSLGLPCISSILDIHAMINWHLSKQGIDQYHVTISPAQVYSSSRSHFFVKLLAD